MKILLPIVILALASGASGASGRRTDDGGRSGRSSTVTLDVKDADVRDVLHALGEQCGVRNMIIDRDVAGAATFYLHDVPCETAFRVVFRTFNLASPELATPHPPSAPSPRTRGEGSRDERSSRAIAPRSGERVAEGRVRGAQR